MYYRLLKLSENKENDSMIITILKQINYILDNINEYDKVDLRHNINKYLKELQLNDSVSQVIQDLAMEIKNHHAI